MNISVNILHYILKTFQLMDKCWLIYTIITISVLVRNRISSYTSYISNFNFTVISVYNHSVHFLFQKTLLPLS